MSTCACPACFDDMFFPTAIFFTSVEVPVLLLLFIGNIFAYASSMCLTLLRRTPHCFLQLVNLLVTFVAFVFFAPCVFNGVYTWGKIFPTHVLRSSMFGLHPGHVLCLGVFFAYFFSGCFMPSWCNFGFMQPCCFVRFYCRFCTGENFSGPCHAFLYIGHTSCTRFVPRCIFRILLSGCFMPFWCDFGFIQPFCSLRFYWR